MANYRKVAKYKPEVREYIKARKWVHRGETLSYGPNIDVGCLTTDGMGFRKSVFRGEKLSVNEVVNRDNYGLVTGPSNVYGFGLPSDSDTIPSLLGKQLGMPCANISLPEGHSRNLFAIVLNLVTSAPKKPAFVLHLSGGDFTGWAYSGIADPVFGPPNLYQNQTVIKERGGRPKPEASFPAMAHSSMLWVRAMVQLCRANRVPFAMGNDTTFFEKTTPTEFDIECGLGVAMAPAQEKQFATQRSLGQQYYARRDAFAEKLSIPIAGPGKVNQIGFVDEFHYDADGSRALVSDFAPLCESAMAAAKR